MNKHVYQIVLGLVFWAFLLIHGTNQIYALSIEQQINLTTIDYATTSIEGVMPAQHSLGLTNWQGDQFANNTVYFEALIRCNECTGGNARVTAGLYTAAGTLVTDSSVNTTNSTFTLVRSAAITGNLTNDTDYTVKIILDAESGTAEIKAARLIIVQSAETITATQSQIDMASAGTSTNAAYELVMSPKLFRYDSENYAPIPTVYFEATLQAIGGSGTAYAALSSTSNCLSIVNGSEISTTNTDYTRVRSNAITLTSGVTYYACYKVSDAATTSLADAKIILNQSHSMGLSKSEISHQLINATVTDSDDTYTLQTYPIQFTPGNFSDARFNYYYETTLMTTADTAYSSLYNLSDSAAITNAENQTASTAYTRIRSTELSSYIPTATKMLDTQIKNSASSMTTVTSSRLLILFSVDPELSFTIEGVANNTVTNGITTTGASQATKLTFGTLVPSEVKYLAHKLTVRTTAASGYSVSVKLLNTLQGYYPANQIEEFPQTWENPQPWSNPDGNTPNVNTGWIGANTSDTRVPNWTNGSGKFGPLGTTSRKVMVSTGIDSGTSVYVTYALEINSHQPTDVYSGTLVYNVTATY